MKRILVLGGSGFIGRHFCEKAHVLDCRITVPTRRRIHGQTVQSLPWVDVIEADVHDETTLAQLVQDHDAVVNLIAILHGNAAAFEQVHVALPQKIVRACQRAGVRRLVHVSALAAAADAPSRYLRSKAQGEAIVSTSGLATSILRPSVVFGAQDRLLNLLARLQAWWPVLPLACAEARFQPVWVQDVASALVRLLQRPGPIAGLADPSCPALVEACGPEVFTLRELARLAGQLAGHPRPILPLPRSLAQLQAWMLEMLPGEPMLSRDNLASMQVDNVASGTLPGLASLGIKPAALRAVATGYLNANAADTLLDHRKLAGRL